MATLLQLQTLITTLLLLVADSLNLLQVEMRVEKAISTLVRLGLVTETPVDSNTKLQAVPCPQAYISLKELWNSLLG